MESLSQYKVTNQSLSGHFSESEPGELEAASGDLGMSDSQASVTNRDLMLWLVSDVRGRVVRYVVE